MTHELYVLYLLKPNVKEIRDVLPTPDGLKFKVLIDEPDGKKDQMYELTIKKGGNND